MERGLVYLKNEKPRGRNEEWTDVNLHLVATGNARLSSDADAPSAYLAAESAVKAKHLGLWSR